MKSARFGLILSVCCLLPLNALAITGVPSLEFSTASIAYTGSGVPTLLVVPDGTGPSFIQARDESGNFVDATVTMILRDSGGFPIVNFPWEDIWLQSSDGGMVSCSWGMHPDQHTDVNGMTLWALPAQASGHSESPVLVMVNGSALTSNNGLPLRFNSPDINADGTVNLVDVSLLSIDYFSGLYHFRCDFNSDGVLNLSDINIFAVHFGARCP